MDNTPINLNNILEQAPKWTFAGDFTLLQWMNQISQDLETRASKTAEALTKLNNNVRSTNIALDNVANSLTTLQFGNQFVEYRVQDDDETLADINEAISNCENKIEHTLTSKEVLNKFLDNNLKVLRNCHEKYSIDLDDSDDEDEEKSKEKTCIYQPINPYNEKPLPFIFGSKDWHAKWHVGLYESQQENSYSGDEISEAFSDSSSTSHLDDNESFESNTEWASSNSIDNDNINTNIEVKNASSLRGSQPIYPVTPSIPINAGKNKPAISESSSVSTPSSSLVNKSIRNAKQNENLTQRSESKNSINSKNSYKNSTQVSSYNKENSLQHKQQPQKVVDLFAEPPTTEDLESTTSSSVSSAQNIKRHPDNTHAIRTDRSSAFKTQPAPFVDLFAEPPEDIPSSTTSSSIYSGRNIKRKTVNLFDDDEDDMVKDDFLSVLTKKETAEKPTNNEKKTLPLSKTTVTDKPLHVTKTPKSLFEDSEDEDDDFLKAFAQRSSSKEATKTSLTKTLLFDNDFQQPPINIQTAKSSAIIASNDDLITPSENTNHKIIFNDTDDNEDDLIYNKTKEEAKNTIQKPKTDDSKPKTIVEKKNLKKSLNLFDDLMDVSKNENLTTEIKPKKIINLFDDLEEEDAEDIFSIKPKQINIKDISQESTLKENAVKSLEVGTEINRLETNNTNNESIAKEILTNKVTTRVEQSSKSNKIAVEDEALNQNKTKTEITENIDNNVSDENKNKEEAQGKPFQIEGKETHSVESSNLETSSNTLSNTVLNNNDNIAIMLVKPETDLTNEKQKSSSTNKYDFNSILLFDEPPEDDDKFFETLSKTPQANNTNYNVIDLENYIYEPELPKVPVSTSGSNNQTDTTDNRQTNLYTGLQLFSDVPPDDDAVSDTINQPPNVNTTKRLHSVFYDDFNETLMALNQNKIEHSIFSNEPPPVNEEIISTSSKDAIDHKVPDVKQEVNQEKHRLKDSPIDTKLEETSAKSDTTKDPSFSTKRPVSKLQMPNININVQALLPGANNTLRNAKEDTTKTKVIVQGFDTIEPVLNVSPAPATEKVATVLTSKTAKVQRTAETEHILPSVTKNRVRAPAARRPSTRRARQENYRKSLIEEATTLQSDDDKNEVRNKTIQTQTKTNIPKNPLIQVQPENNDRNIQKQTAEEIFDNIPNTDNKNTKEEFTKPLPSTNTEEALVDIPKTLNKITKKENTTPFPSNLSDNRHADNSKIFNISKNASLEVNKETNILKTEPQRNLQSSSSIQNNQNLTKQHKQRAKSLLFFDDDEEEDDDLFKNIKTSKPNVNKTVATTRENSEKLEQNKKIVSSSSNLFANNTNMEVTHEIQVSPNSLNISTTTDYKQQKLSKNDNQANIDISKKSSTTTTKSPYYDEYNDIFRRTDQKPTTSNTFKDSNSRAKSQFKSFLDSESDEDLVAGLHKDTSTPTQTASSIKNPIASAPPAKNTTAKLFADSDTDSDDLFGKLSSTKTTKTSKTSNYKVSSESSTQSQNKAPARSSLFSDDSDADDFPVSSASIKKNAAPKSVLKDNKSKVNTQANTSLFSDVDSDEDDLFGSGAAKVANTTDTNIPNTNALSATKPIISATEVTKSKTVADNPLADLL